MHLVAPFRLRKNYYAANATKMNKASGKDGRPEFTGAKDGQCQHPEKEGTIDDPRDVIIYLWAIEFHHISARFHHVSAATSYSRERRANYCFFTRSLA